MRLLDRRAAVPVLSAQLVREMHYWLLVGRHGTAIRQLGWPDGHVQRIARAVAVLRAEFAQPLPVKRLAAVAGMSPSSFFEHFRAVRQLSPRQFQKHLRLIEATTADACGRRAGEPCGVRCRLRERTQVHRRGVLAGRPPRSALAPAVVELVDLVDVSPWPPLRSQECGPRQRFPHRRHGFLLGRTGPPSAFDMLPAAKGAAGIPSGPRPEHPTEKAGDVGIRARAKRHPDHPPIGACGAPACMRRGF